MKNYIIVLGLLFLLTSCFGESDEITKMKQDMGVIKNENGLIEVKDTIEQVKNDDKNEEMGDPRIRITQVSGDALLVLDSLKYEDFKGGHVKITGKTLEVLDSISVFFSNEDSDFKDDTFTLKKFNPVDQVFEYNASSRYNVLDFGLNKYLFTAKKGDRTSVLQLEVMVSIKDDKILSGNTREKIVNISEDNTEKLPDNRNDMKNIEEIFSNLPEGGDYGNVVKIGENKVTYSDIKGLEIKKIETSEITCQKNRETDTYYITELLAKTQGSWYYWNTCRDIVKGNGIMFFVTRLDGKNYIYEKHYVDTSHGLYGIYELESGTGATSKNLNDINKGLKNKNGSFTQLKIVNSLFQKIVK